MVYCIVLQFFIDGCHCASFLSFALCCRYVYLHVKRFALMHICVIFRKWNKQKNVQSAAKPRICHRLEKTSAASMVFAHVANIAKTHVIRNGLNRTQVMKENSIRITQQEERKNGPHIVKRKEMHFSTCRAKLQRH